MGQRYLSDESQVPARGPGQGRRVRLNERAKCRACRRWILDEIALKFAGGEHAHVVCPPWRR